MPEFSEPGEKHTTLPGPVEPDKEDTTLIIANHNQPNIIVAIEQIDKKQSNKTAYKNKAGYKLAPGMHTVFYYLVSQKHALAVTAVDLNISFSAEAGHLYELKNYTRWDDKFPEKINTIDFLTMVIDTTEGKVVAWESRGTGDFKEEVKSKTGFKFKEWTEKNAVNKDKFADTRQATLSTDNETFFSDFVNKGNKYGLNKAVFLDFVYKGDKYGIYFIVNRAAYEKLVTRSRPPLYGKRKENNTKKDFILTRIDNPLQKEKLLPLVEKIKSLTPDVHEQARIAISLVQNIPYTDVASYEKYPYGVIWEHGGACSEKSDLLLFILRELGFGTATLIYKNENHRVVGIKCPDVYDISGSGYCFVEVTTPKIITDNLPNDLGPRTLTDVTTVRISDGIQLEGVEEESADKILYYELINKAKTQKGFLKRNDYDLYNSILIKYGMEEMR